MKKNLIIGLIIILLLFFNSLYGAEYSEKRIYANDGILSDYFGHAVAADNDKVIVGAWGDDDKDNYTGAVYLFENDGGLWTQSHKFVPGDGNGDEYFGKAVAIEGNYVVVGAPEYEGQNVFGTGVVYIYEYNGSAWSEQKLIPADGSSGDGFGISVAISGDYILIGSFNHDLTGKADAGAVYVYKKGADSWDFEKKITLDTDAAVGDNFGVSVALFEDRALIGAFKKDGPGNVQDMGAAYVFERDGVDWLFTRKLEPDESSASLNFGQSVSLYENYAVVGSPTNSQKTTGHIYVFGYTGSVWNQEAKLVPADITGENWWGSSVAVENNMVIGGDYINGDHGAVYIYQKNNSTWDYIQKITPTDAQTTGGDKFGYSVALSSNKLFIGARDGLAREGGAEIEMAGAAYIYSPTGPPPVVADFNANVTAGFIPLEVDFTDQSTGEPTTWEWDFGDHNSSTLQNPTHIYTSPGVYNITLKVTNSTSENTVVKENYISVRVQQPENYIWTNYSRETMFAGANQNTVNAMCYNPFDGHIIVGTSGGVAEFSGVFWRHYEASDNDNWPQVYAVAVDSSGAKWFGLSSGARVFGSDTTKHDPTESRVNDIFVRSNGHVWMATANGLAYYDGLDWTVYTTANSGLSVNNINRVTMDKSEDVLIVSTQGGGVCVLENETWETYTTDQGLSENIVYNVVLDRNWDAWIAPYWGSIIKFVDDSAYTYQPLGTGENDIYFSAVGLDSSGNVWAAGQHSGIARFDGVVWTHLDTSNSDLSSNLVRCKDILVEPNGVIWFGTWDAGVCRFGTAITQAVDFYANITRGTSPLTVQFYGFVNSGTPDYWGWDFDNDGTLEVFNEQNPSYTFDTPGDYTVRLFAPVGSTNLQKIKTGYIKVESSGGETGSLSGKVTDATTGDPISGATVTLGDSSTTTDSGGNYSFTNIPVADLIADFSANPRSGKAPLTVQFTDQSGYGRQLLSASATGYSDFSTYITISKDGTTFDISLSPIIAEGGMRLVLNWGQTPLDLDIHLKTPEIEGSEYEILWSNKGSSDSPPYVLLDKDDTDGYGPETITIHQLKSGTYTCFIYNYSESPAITQSGGVVQIYDDDGLINTVNVPGSGTGLYWYICDINGTNGNVTIVNTIQDSPPGGASYSSYTAEKKNTSVNNIDGITGTSAVTSWAWDFNNDGVTDDTSKNPTFTYPSAGTYSVKLTVSDGTQTDDVLKTEYITVTTGDTVQFGQLSGKVTDATTGNPIQGATVSIGDSSTTTDAQGNYSFDHIPASMLTADFSGSPRSGYAPLTVQFTDLSSSGMQLVTATATGYYNYSRYIYVSTSGTTLNITLSPVFTEGDLRLVLSWDDLPQDMDIHLITPEIGGKPYEVSYRNTGSKNSPPYAVLDIDDTNGSGPETITVYSLVTGTYKCYVENFSKTPAITTSNGIVQVYGTTGLLHTISVPTSGTGEYWYVCDIDGATGNVTIVNTLQSDPLGSLYANMPFLPKRHAPEAQIDGFAEANADIVSWAWDFDNDGSVDNTTSNPSYTYTEPGTYTVKLTVSDGVSSDDMIKVNYITVTSRDTTQYGKLSGKVTDATTGNPIEGATVSVAGLNTTTDAQGNYTFEKVPVGALTANFSGSPLAGYAPLTVQFTDYSGSGMQLVTATATGYYSYSRNVSITTSGVTLNISLSPVFTEGDLRLVLSWDDSPPDMDIHLITPEIGGKPYEVSYLNTGDKDSPPYAVLDIDDTNGIGPETITVYSLVTGTYKCYVENFSKTPAITTSNGIVQVYGTTGLLHTISVPTSGTGEYWYVCDIDGATGNVTIVNTLQSDPLGSSYSHQRLSKKKTPPANTEGAGENAAAIVSWAWDFNDDGTIDATTQNPVYTFANAGTYTVSLTVSDGTKTDVERKINYITVTENIQLIGYDVVLSGIDHSGFPYIETYTAVVDSSNNPVTTLAFNDFTLTEDGVSVTIDSVNRISKANPGKADIVFVIDVESRIGTRLADLTGTALKMADSLAANGLDCRYGLVAFRDRVVVAHDLTSDAAQFKMWLGALTLVNESNIQDNALDALAKASQLNYRSHAQRMTLLITDDNYHVTSDYTSYTASSVINMLNANGITNHVIGFNNSSFRTLAASTGGLFYNINNDFLTTLDKFVSMLTSQYVLSYLTYNQTPTDAWRNVVVSVENLGYGGFDAAQYYIGSSRITLGPDKIPGIVHSVFSLDILAESIINLNACNISMIFDTTALQYVDRNVGPFLGQGGQTVLDSTTTGVNSVYIKLRRSATDGVNGSGVLYTIRFRVLKEYSANPFTFNFVNLKTPSGTTIPAASVGINMESPYEYDAFNNKISKLRGDFDNDLDVDTGDFALLATYWGKPDSAKGDIGPATGTLPFLTTVRDTLVNFEDLFVFTQSWNWYHLNFKDSGGSLLKSAATLEWRITDDIENSKTIHVELWADNMNNLAMGHLLFKYDQTVLKFENASAGELFAKDTPAVALFAEENKTSGIVDIAMARLVGKENNPQVSGSGVIACFEFERIDLTAGSTIELKEADFRSAANKKFFQFEQIDIHLDGMNLPKTYALSRNFPNPFNHSTQLEYSLPKTSFVTIEIFNILGQPVRTLVDSKMDPGTYRIIWDGKNNSGLEVVSGIYFVRMKSNSFKKVREMLFLK
ncbi:PKD domain-containing protein [candidate division KSB1 bacterium]|nr:PKD domain-containing protein [candidate division KSB1 bacterium]